jgi:acyl-CoA dehydrogenase
MNPNHGPSLDFGLGETADAIREATARFAAERIAPRAAEIDASNAFPRELWPEMGALGLHGVTVEEEWGGLGLGYLEHVLAMEEVSRASASIGLSYGAHSNLCINQIRRWGGPEQKRRYLPRLISGEHVGALAMSEAGSGSDVMSMKLRAERRGDRYVVNGSKTFITNGFLAGVVLVVCKTDPAQGARGTSILIVETEGCQGFRVGRVLDKIGMKAQDTSELFFEDVEVPAENLLGGAEGQGFYQLMGDLPYERLIIGVAALAAMEGAYESTLAYVREREAFGQPIANFQNTRFKLAEVATQITVGRAFIDRCVERLVDGTLDTATASMAKLWASEAQGRVLDELLQLHGGYGFMSEYMIARMYADARVQRIYGGTSEIMKEVIARSL